MSHQKVQAVLFDMGGVLVDFGVGGGLPPQQEDWRGRRALLGLLTVARWRGGRWSETDLESQVFNPWRRDHARRMQMGREASWTPHLDRLRRAARSDLDDETFLQAWFEPYAEELDSTLEARTVVAGVVERGCKCGLVSNVPLPGSVYRPILERGGLWDLFASHCFSYDLGTRKPSPGMVRKALSDLDVEPERAVMVGDRKNVDVAVGRMAGLRTVWLRSAHDQGPRPDAIIERLADLSEVIDRWNQGEEANT